MPVLPIEDAPNDGFMAAVVYALATYPKPSDEAKRDEVIATFFGRVFTQRPEYRPVLEDFTAKNPWFFPAALRAGTPEEVMKETAVEHVSGWACGELLLLMLSAAAHHPDLEVTTTKALWVMSELYRGAKSRTGTTVSASPRYFWKAWGKFKTVAHFHAVRPVWMDHFGDYSILTPEVIREYLAIAESIRHQAVARRFLPYAKTWSVPKSLELPDITYHPDPLEPKEIDLFRRYKPEHSRC
ncbi:MAG TPA: hypothetical protein VIE43_06470 [Thermoanaerobaculia bacterium]|jgi:hypothetical protein|nr:hypothetical protein [Thermoanaerobaculia bacterium]